ncbi:hypothetical protein Lalb_Chr01g0013521 [Lupinus albus]|uniref:Uncharacterized protein n=1 Tax=Lupinus albus TaxID=3870 RepID=A0A6A4R7K8_LUPAL|nr:hypothetical protein Lalb_Chr01g0013521 [Lupinus albus]
MSLHFSSAFLLVCVSLSLCFFSVLRLWYFDFLWLLGFLDSLEIIVTPRLLIFCVMREFMG